MVETREESVEALVGVSAREVCVAQPLAARHSTSCHVQRGTAAGAPAELTR